ncbi:hypothetical protein BCR43DRAFT_487906 [Syncephalastrum racemosum]|uniref:Uncharacterized protein n=1 Tax=Syncephalastrum racemosum TaxID=13706 RepID=A0A1X2HHT2_SYNRA|nr:hypothetical protein BCR43DRAFT_487906 [Syncephalastrum racemosum]
MVEIRQCFAGDPESLAGPCLLSSINSLLKSNGIFRFSTSYRVLFAVLSQLFLCFSSFNMYRFDSPSSDPYAGQYPKPPPPPQEDKTTSGDEYQSPHTVEASVTAPTSAPPAAASAAAAATAVKAAPLVAGAFSMPHHDSPYFSTPLVAAMPQHHEYYDPEAMPLQDYHNQYNPQPPRAMYQQQQQQQQQQQHSAPQQGQYFPPPQAPFASEQSRYSSEDPRGGYYENVPISGRASVEYAPDAPEEKKDEKRSSSGWFKKSRKSPAVVPDEEEARRRVRPAPEDEKPDYEASRRREDRRNDRNCCCCCYNPALTCCSCFCMLISLVFLAAGIALMIASKVVRDKCNNSCGGDGSGGLDECSVLCSTALHDGFLYGGAVVTGLAGIAVIWRLFMWCCAGYSRK